MALNKKGKIISASIVTLILSVVFVVLLIQAVWISPSSETTLASDGSQSEIPLPANLLPNSNSTNSSSSGVSPGTDNLSKGNKSATATADPSWPVKLTIPVLGIEANVQRVGVGRSGNMAVPTNYTDVGWYRYGTVPGNIGSAVFDGHVDNGLGLPGVFKHLADINVGDDIYVVNEAGQKIHFKVSSVDVYDYKNVPTEVIFKQNDNSYIRLITCDGSWVKGDKTYNERLVVSAIIVP